MFKLYTEYVVYFINQTTDLGCYLHIERYTLLKKLTPLSPLKFKFIISIYCYSTKIAYQYIHMYKYNYVFFQCLQPNINYLLVYANYLIIY